MRRFVVIAFVIAVFGGVSVADQINWYDSALINDRFGVPVSESSGWLIQMYDAGANAVIDAFGSGDDSLIVGASTTFNLGPATDGWFYDNIFNPAALGISIGDDVFTRVFDSSTVGGASYFVNVGGVQVVGDYSVPPGTGWNYDTGGEPGGNWQVIPEPGTFALFGLGLLTIAARRRFRK